MTPATIKTNIEKQLEDSLTQPFVILIENFSLSRAEWLVVRVSAVSVRLDAFGVGRKSPANCISGIRFQASSSGLLFAFVPLSVEFV